MRRKHLKNFQYLVSDFLTTYGVWLAFVVLRRELLEGRGVLDPQQFVNAGVIGIYWLILYAAAGLYGQPYRRSRLKEISQIFKYTIAGVLIIFFLIFLDDPVPPQNPSLQRGLLLTYFVFQLGAVSLVRFAITTATNIRIRRGQLGFPTLLIGSGQPALQILKELARHKRSLGYQFQGYITLNGKDHGSLNGELPHFGDLEKLEEVVLDSGIEEIIIALEDAESREVGRVIEICERTPVIIKVVPGTYDYIVGSVKSAHILGAPLIEVFPQIMKPWEWALKRAFDVGVSVVALILLAPVFGVIALASRLDSEGPVFYTQERIGKHGKPFRIIKFRTMIQDAEKAGPSLSSDHDPRITRVGLWLRKTRMDELPQFWNVLRGDMSIVGPRPERQFFIDQIIRQAPHYRHLHKVRPGITSWGQVKYGYASNVEEMIERLKFDILYMENMSLGLDFKILLYTFIVIIEGRGK